MAYDKADWHYNGDFPKRLPIENGATHIGMFLAWAILNDLHGSIHREFSAEALERVRRRAMTGRDFVMSQCDERFTTEDLNEIGNAFAQAYYAAGVDATPSYLVDYSVALAQELPTLYHVKDSWQNYDIIAPIISQRFEEWRRSRSGPS